MKKRRGKKILKAVLSVFLAFVLVVVGYLAYLLLSYSRIEDKLELMPDNKGDSAPLEIGTQYSVFIQNIGFGAYTQDFTFFMDGGEESRAESEQSVKKCVGAAADMADSFDPDFIMLQEVDTDSTRSHHVDQQKIIEDRFGNYSSVFAKNYDSAYLFYPFSEPHGASQSGILTLSKFDAESAERRSLPISESLSKFLDLDRCYSVSRFPLENGKELVLYNVHLSAYGGSDEIRTAQMTMLFKDMKSEYDRGNYCLCGGDFNHDFTGDSTQKLNGGASVDFGWAQPFPEELLPEGISRCTDYEDPLVPTCRNCDIPYKEGNFTIIVDGFLASDNIEVESVKNVDTDFLYSDHNPVFLEFILK